MRLVANSFLPYAVCAFALLTANCGDSAGTSNSSNPDGVTADDEEDDSDNGSDEDEPKDEAEPSDESDSPDEDADDSPSKDDSDDEPPADDAGSDDEGGSDDEASSNLDDAGTEAVAEDAGAESVDAGGGAEPDEEGDDDGVYALQIAIFAPDETLNYVMLSQGLDLIVDEDRLKGAREFAGYTGVEAIGGYIYAADGAAPFIRKYEITEDLKWKDVGELNFSEYPMDEYNYMNFYFQSIKDDDNVYFFYGADKTSRVVWSPSDWKIVDSFKDTELPIPEEGWLLANGGNRTGMRDFEGPVVQPFNVYNEATYENADTSYLAVYDEDTHAEKDLIEVPCPGIQQVTKDEQGDLWFSTTYNFPTAAISDAGPAPCVVKVKANGTLDDEFEPNDLADWTGGFYGVNFRYLHDNKAVANVLHHDRIEGLDPNGEVDSDIAVQIEEDASLWELHVIDVEEGSSKIVTGFKEEHDVAWYTIFIQEGDRTFVVVQLDTETTGSAVYELNTDTAKVKFIGDSIGDIWGVTRVR